MIKEGEECLFRLQHSVISPSGQAQQLERMSPPTTCGHFTKRDTSERLRQHCVTIWGRLNRFPPLFYIPNCNTTQQAKELRDGPIVMLIQDLLVLLLMMMMMLFN